MKAYSTWSNDKQKQASIEELSNAIDSSKPIFRGKGYDSFQNILTDISVRENFTNHDWEEFRRDEQLPKNPKDIISACDSAYKGEGLVRNVIDLMGDFAGQGVRLVHPNQKIEKFHKQWFEEVKGQNITERFFNLLYRQANIIIERMNTTISRKEFERMPKIDFDEIELPREGVKIPIDYKFLSPLSVDVVDADLAMFGVKPRYKLNVNKGIVTKMEKDGGLANRLTPELRQLIRKIEKNGTLLLDPENTLTFFYKKDDWELWACPMLFSILRDLRLLKKLKLADLAALDGVIQRIRVWKLGSLDHKLLPNQVAIDKLGSLLLPNAGAGSIDLIWGPDIELQETSTDVHQFLGEEKYVSTLNSIYAGLGIPQTLTGQSKSSGFSNNYIAIKTLVERLRYGRNVLLTFWNEELKIIQKAFRFRQPAQVVFERMTLSDEHAEKALMIQLADRDIISLETIQERFGEIPELEQVRMRREERLRGSGDISKKAGPWHHPQQDFDFKKILLQSGQVTSSELGVVLEERKRGEKTLLEIKELENAKKLKGEPQQGRPFNSKDSKKRKTKRVLPKTKSVLYLWARSAQKFIADTCNEPFLQKVGKSNLRQLTDAEFDTLERFKFGVLMGLEPNSDLNIETIERCLGNYTPVTENVILSYGTLVTEFEKVFSRKPILDEKRELQVSVYLFFKEGEIDGEI